MPSWNDLLEEFGQAAAQGEADQWLHTRLTDSLVEVSNLRDDRNVLLYSSGFLQKPQAPAALLQLSGEDLNGFMSTIYQMDWDRGLTLILHTPGGVTNAAETVVEYLRSKFDSIEVIVPAFAMSAGTMMSLAADSIIMGRQSQLGPIDPQLPMPATGRSVSARSIVDQFAKARQDILADRATAHAWAPVLSTLGHGLLQEAQNALDYGERMVAEWLYRWMLNGQEEKALEVAAHFNAADLHKSHGRRIDRDEARSTGVIVEDLEDNQELQEAVLTAYHMMTITYQQSTAVRFIVTGHGRQWVKHWQP